MMDIKTLQAIRANHVRCGYEDAPRVCDELIRIKEFAAATSGQLELPNAAHEEMARALPPSVYRAINAMVANWRQTLEHVHAARELRYREALEAALKHMREFAPTFAGDAIVLGELVLKENGRG